MKKTSRLILFALLAANVAAVAGEKKNVPSTREIETLLQTAGTEHSPEKMRINKVGSLETEESYYHIFSGSLRKGGYRVIFVDNSENYLGYYATEYEPVDYEEDAILLDSGESDEDGNMDYYSIFVGINGPSEKISIDGIPILFVKNLKLEEKAAKATTEGKATDGSIQPEYREWIITHKGKKIPVRAIYVKQSKGNVFLKSEAKGITQPFSLNALSKEDKAYLKELEQ